MVGITFMGDTHAKKTIQNVEVCPKSPEPCLEYRYSERGLFTQNGLVMCYRTLSAYRFNECHEHDRQASGLHSFFVISTIVYSFKVNRLSTLETAG